MSAQVRDGIILVDKPAGMTSHDVVDFLRRQLGTRRVGHTGILDPGATGLLVALIGRGTLFSSLLTGMPKRYYSRFAFGVSTDTYDADGQPVKASDPGTISFRDFEKLLQKYVGEIEQAIPPFSATKRRGKTFHKLARQGQAFNPGLKVVVIESIEIVDFDWPEVALDIRCSSGTYVRSLAHQMGETLGCGGYLKNLRRLEVGPFRLSDALTLNEIAKSMNPEESIKPLKEALPSHPAIRIKPQYCGAILNGRPLMKKYIDENDYKGDGGVLSLLLDPDEKVLALATLNMLWKALDRLGPSEIMGTYVRVIDEGHIRFK
jgi:tRNA pseudouridine55 synthase